MISRPGQGRGGWLLLLAAGPMLALLVLPLVALALSSSPADLAAGVGHPLFGPALRLSARTTLISLAVIVATGTPEDLAKVKASATGEYLKPVLARAKAPKTSAKPRKKAAKKSTAPSKRRKAS